MTRPAATTVHWEIKEGGGSMGNYQNDYNCAEIPNNNFSVATRHISMACTTLNQRVQLGVRESYGIPG